MKHSTLNIQRRTSKVLPLLWPRAFEHWALNVECFPSAHE